jgi:hypothetical protein
VCFSMRYEHHIKSEAIPVTGRGGPCGCGKSRLPRFLDNEPKDCGEVVSPMHRQPWYSFVLEAGSTTGHSVAGSVPVEISSDLTGIVTRYFLYYITVPQPTMVLRTSLKVILSEQRQGNELAPVSRCSLSDVW